MSRVAALAFLVLVSGLAVAQEAYPSRAVTMIVPFPPGGVADIVGRPLASMMEKTLKHPVVIVNRTLLGGNVVRRRSMTSLRSCEAEAAPSRPA